MNFMFSPRTWVRLTEDVGFGGSWTEADYTI